jgi:hypothetical protein
LKNSSSAGKETSHPRPFNRAIIESDERPHLAIG